MIRHSGYTLIELIVAIAIAALLIAIAVPSFLTTVRNNRGVADANGMLAVLTLARSEAIRRDNYVSICVSTTSTPNYCASSGTWDQGYLMFVDSSACASPPSSAVSSTQLIRTEAPLSEGSTISYIVPGGSTTPTCLTFNGQGQLNSSAWVSSTTNVGYFSVLPNQSTKYSYGKRYVVLRQIGRAVVCDPTTNTTCGTK
ncbi:MAG: GspH/FimT family pseudopilin [Nevskia sp.]|nr:GspH/FimT family pseudopilin [Nevskia sp.]